MTDIDLESVRRSVDVVVPVATAWAVFTERMGEWWPLATHSLSAEHDRVPQGVVVEGRVGGLIYEVAGDDRLTWGTVVEWEPPQRLAVDWTVGGAVVTRWTASFTATDAGTHVEVVHGGFEAHGANAQEMRASYGSDDGWTLVLARFQSAADESS